ncbi:unnamed protein product [Sphagnum jensenii]|uniref:Uncharacterized protein n=1 Tax=Sphagnum jensenii TaxID=128206 RepID=A0ABP1AK21_9BRYO
MRYASPLMLLWPHTNYGCKKTPLAKLDQILNTKAEFGCVDGDGTVPRESAMVLKHWLMAGDPDPFYDSYTDFVILPSKEVEIEDDKEKTISIIGLPLDMDEIHTDPSQHRVHVPIVSTSTDFCFIYQSDNFLGHTSG